MKKVRTGTILYPKTIKLCDNKITKANVSSRNDFIEKAINFYVGYLNTQENIEFINEVIDYTITSKLDLFEESFSSLLFKLTVELDMLMKILAANFDIDEETLKKLREKSIIMLRKQQDYLILKRYLIFIKKVRIKDA